MKIISMCHFNRPEYSRSVLEHMAACEGVENYLIIPAVDPGNQEVRELIEGISFAECRPIFQERRLGCSANTLSALEAAFHYSDFVIHIEDDVPPAPDALLLFEQCCKMYRDDEHVFSISAYYRDGDGSPATRQKLARRNHFTPWVWGTWKDRFSEMRAGWCKHHKLWDMSLNQLRAQRCEIYPLLSRSQNIGALGGVTRCTEKWHQDTRHVQHWARGYDVEASLFQE